MGRDKIKFILIGIIGIVVIIFAFLFIQTVNEKRQVMQERDELFQKKEDLTKNVSELKGTLNEYSDKINSLNKDLENSGIEKKELEVKFEAANMEKEELSNQVKSLQAQLSQAAQQPQAQPEIKSTDSYWAGVLRAKTELELQLSNMRVDLKTMQINNEQLLRDKGLLEIEVKNFSTEKDDLKRQVDYDRKLVDNITQELVREKNDRARLLENFKSISGQNAILTRQLRGLNTRKAALEKKLQQLQEDNTAIERKFDEMETILTDRITQIKTLKDQLDDMHKGRSSISSVEKESVELPTIVVRPSYEPEQLRERAAFGQAEGKIFKVVRDQNFVIIDLGQESGIREGDTLQVSRDAKPIGEIQVLQARKDISACDIKKEIESIRVGDTVR